MSSGVANAMALVASRPALIDRIFVGVEHASVGMYAVRICKNGDWTVIVIDDLIPCLEGKPLFITSTTAEVWPMLLHKAFAKLHGGYDGLQECHTEAVLMDLTGGISHMMPVGRGDTLPEALCLDDTREHTVMCGVSTTMGAMGLLPEKA